MYIVNDESSFKVKEFYFLTKKNKPVFIFDKTLKGILGVRLEIKRFFMHLVLEQLF